MPVTNSDMILNTDHESWLLMSFHDFGWKLSWMILSSFSVMGIISGFQDFRFQIKDFDKNNSYAQIKGKYTDYSESSFFTDSKEFSFSDSNEMPDDNYEMNYFLCDLAGNNIEGCLSFTLNRTGSTYEISEELENIIGNTVSEVGEISLTERNISRILSKLSNQKG